MWAAALSQFRQNPASLAAALKDIPPENWHIALKYAQVDARTSSFLPLQGSLMHTMRMAGRWRESLLILQRHPFQYEEPFWTCAATCVRARQWSLAMRVCAAYACRHGNSDPRASETIPSVGLLIAVTRYKGCIETEAELCGALMRPYDRLRYDYVETALRLILESRSTPWTGALWCLARVICFGDSSRDRLVARSVSWMMESDRDYPLPSKMVFKI